MKRIPPSSKLRQEVEEVFIGWETEGHPLDNFIKLGARYMLQVAVEQEVEDYLGRAHYHRGSRRKNGWRNGYEPGKVIPRFPTESAGLRLLYTTLITTSQTWKGIRMTPDIWLEPELLRQEASGKPSQFGFWNEQWWQHSNPIHKKMENMEKRLKRIERGKGC